MKQHEVTPITKRAEQFDEIYREVYKRRFSSTYVDIIYDAFCVRIDNSWVEKKLIQGELIEIYKDIIFKAREEYIIAYKENNDIYKLQVENIKKYYQKELLEEVHQVIRDYCMEV